MVKKIPILIFVLFSQITYSQGEFERLLENGKYEFNKPFEQQNYSAAADSLEKAVALNPNDPEAHYFLGYAYSRMNAKDGTNLDKVHLPLTLKASKEFEIVNQLSPEYTGETVISDPYSKLTSEWGTLALAYLTQNKSDSAVWAYTEGKKRGGFGDFFLSAGKETLNSCSKNALLISSGDNCLFPMMYLQNKEKYRQDVTIIDLSLLNTRWYPRFLSEKYHVKFDLPLSEIDELEYCEWSDSLITISNARNGGYFTWTVPPNYYDMYLLRGDRIFLSVLKENGCTSDIYFTKSFTPNMQVGLSPYLLSYVLTDKFNPQNETIDFKRFKSDSKETLSFARKMNRFSRQELTFFETIRYNILKQIYMYSFEDRKKEAQELFDLFNKYASPEKYSFTSETLSVFYDELKNELK